MELLYGSFPVSPYHTTHEFADRLENEHLGNMDQYRVTREVPLPYTFDDTAHDDDADEEGDEEGVPDRSWLAWRRSIHS